MASSEETTGERLTAIEERMFALERAFADSRRRQLLAELRHDASRLLAGVREVRRIVPEQLDELSDVLARWDVPLSPEERSGLQQAALLAQGVAGSGGAKVHLVVEVVTTAAVDDLERAAAGARVFSVRNRRAIPVLISLEEPSPEIVAEAAGLGVELVVGS